jgi:predicted HD superfamily hydrolase involved in NAD metabolism
LAVNFALDPAAAFCAGWLHDISAIWPVSERLAVAESAGLPIYAEERAAPLLLHQRLSALLAEQVFAVHDAAVLSALGCHTTLKAQASDLDLALFVADKLAWDQPGEASFHPEMRAAARTSLTAAAQVYLHDLWEQRASLPAVHPWLRDAWWEYLPQLTET